MPAAPPPADHDRDRCQYVGPQGYRCQLRDGHGDPRVHVAIVEGRRCGWYLSVPVPVAQHALLPWAPPVPRPER